MRRFIQSVGTQLSLALLLVVAIALGVVYLTVVPSLRERAIDTRVADLTGIAAKLRPQVRPQDPLTDEWVATASEENEGVRVVLLNRLAPSGLVVPYRDSGQLSPRLQGDPVATHALDSNAPQHGTVTDGADDLCRSRRPGAPRRATRCSCATRSSSGASGSSSGACCSPPAWRC